MGERDHSYLVTIPRRHGGSYSVMLDSGYFTEGEEDTEEHALASVTGSISDLKASVLLTQHLVDTGIVTQVGEPDDEADDYPDDLDYDAATVRRLNAEEAKKTPCDTWWG